MAPFDVTNGSISCCAVSSWDDETLPGIKWLMDNWWNPNGCDPKRRVFCTQDDWSAAFVFEHTVEKAVERVGWDNLTSMEVKKEMFKLDHWWAPLHIKPHTYSPTKMTPVMNPVYEFQDGKAIMVGDWKDSLDLRPARFR